MFLASLRRRNQRLEAKMSKLPHNPAAPAPTKDTTAQPPPRPPREFRFRLAISVFLLVVFTVYQQSRSGQGGKTLPKVYGICSKDGRKSVYTSEDGRPAVECVVVDGKRIADLGSLSHVRRIWGEKDTLGPTIRSPWSVRKTGLPIYWIPEGAALTPGIVDSHAHTLEYGWSRQLPLLGSSSISDVISKVESYVSSHQDQINAGAWIEGMGWDQNIWDEKVFPSAADLESSPHLRGLPISLKRIDIHAEWVSKAVLDLMGELPEIVEGGEIIRDDEGNPTGVFTDDAISLIDAIRPPRTHSQMLDDLRLTVRDGVEKGLTGIHDALAFNSTVEFFKRMAEEDKLPIRFYLMLACPNKEQYCGDDFEMIHNAADGRLNMRSVKLFADGALGSWGAALLEPYSDRPDTSGTMRIPDNVWKPLINDFVQNGWQVNVHTIGDKANRLAIEAMESALGGPGANGTDKRLRLEHAQIMELEDLQKAAELGVIASYQPTHATSDMWYAEERLGSERIKGAYAWRRYLEHGGRITLGSDFPVESIDPLKGFYAAVSRRSEDGKSPMGPDGWYPDQKLSREEALRGMTIDGAYASFQENDVGSFAIGKRFDAVLWDKDLMTVDIDEMLETRVLATLVDGRCVYGHVSGRT